MKNKLAVIILAAGKSTRMKSETPKVLHHICGRPVLSYVLDTVKELKADKVVAVLGYKHEEVSKILPKGVKAVIQHKLIGTADAVKTALAVLRGFRGTVLVLYGDTPLLKKDTINKLLKYHNENSMDATLLIAQLEKPAGYGRVLRDEYTSVCGIKEDKDADDFEKDIKEINTGIICFNKQSLSSVLGRIRPNNRKKEYYLTDAVTLLYNGGKLVDGIKIADINEALGINSRVELAKANGIMQARINERLMLEGVSIVDPSSAFISYGTKIGRDTVIYPFTAIESNVKIGKRCFVGPFAHLREGTVLEDDVVIGNFFEAVRARVGAGTWAKHFSYLGDAKIGRKVNIGAGTVIANFDGKNKHFTAIKDKAMIGSDTVLVAPVTVGKGSMTGAGSIVTRDVADNTVVAGVPARALRKKR